MKSIKLLIFTSFMSINVFAQTAEEALNYADKEQYEKAKSILKPLIKADVKVGDSYFYLGEVYYKSEKYDSAKYWYKEGVKFNENNPLSYVGLGKVSMAENPTEGKANFDKAISIAKKDARVYAAIGEYWIISEKPDAPKAIELINKAVSLDQKKAAYKLLLGDAYLENHDGTMAIAQYKAGLALDPKSPLSYWKIGKLYLASRNYEEGKNNFNESIKNDPSFSPAYRELGELYYRAKKFDKAIENYKKYLELRDKSDDADFRYASFLFLNADYNNSITIMNNLVAKNYENPAAYRMLGYSLYETKEYDKALQNMDIFWKKIESKKVISQDYEYYGKILMKKGQDSLGVSYLYKAIEKDTSKTELYGEIANGSFTAKKYKAAAEAYKKKIEATKATAKPTALANDYLSLGRSYLFDKKYESADSAFAKITEIKPDLNVGYFWRARANGYIDPKQEKALAKPYYEKFIELSKADPEKNKQNLVESYAYLGSYYLFVNKDKAKADEAWNNVRTLDPTNKAAAEAAKIK